MENIGLPAAFSIWAAVVGMIGVAIVWELSRLRNEVRTLTENLNEYIVTMERRVTHMESHMTFKHDDFKPMVK